MNPASVSAAGVSNASRGISLRERPLNFRKVDLACRAVETDSAIRSQTLSLAEEVAWRAGIHPSVYRSRVLAIERPSSAPNPWPGNLPGFAQAGASGARPERCLGRTDLHCVDHI